MRTVHSLSTPKGTSGSQNGPTVEQLLREGGQLSQPSTNWLGAADRPRAPYSKHQCGAHTLEPSAAPLHRQRRHKTKKCAPSGVHGMRPWKLFILPQMGFCFTRDDPPCPKQTTTKRKKKKLFARLSKIRFHNHGSDLKTKSRGQAISTD